MATGKHCFVGHVFNQEQIADLRRAIREAFDAVAAVPILYADEYLTDGDLFRKVTKAIDNSLFCIFEVSSTDKPNVFLELGYAKRAEKKCILLIRKGCLLPSDLAGYDHIEYKSYADLTAKLTDLLPGFLGKQGDVDMRVFLAVEEQIGVPSFSTKDVHRRAEQIGQESIPALKVEESLAMRQSAG
ncbi:MAG: hypothetical protein ACU836_16030, partial [Gammaproteobacteria bacterium]